MTSLPPATAGPLLPLDMLALMDKGVSVIVSSCDRTLRPSIMRALGSLIAPGAATITVYLSRVQSGQLLQDITSTGRIAVVFSQPTSHRTVQVKSSNARLRDAVEADRSVLARYLSSMEQEIGRIGYGRDFVGAMFAGHLEDLVAISFEPEQAFDQTPGPKAGANFVGDGSTQQP